MTLPFLRNAFTCILIPIAGLCLYADSQSSDSALTEELASGRIGVNLTARPDSVQLDKPMFVTLTVSAPEKVVVEWPDLTDRFDGFEITDSFESGSRLEKGRSIRDLQIRLLPKSAAEYRLKPMALGWRENQSVTNVSWIKTKPVTFRQSPLQTATGLEEPAPPLRVPLSPKQIGLRIAAVATLLAALVLLYRLARRVKRAIRLRQMSPRQRAILELDELIARRLIEQGLIKEFYFELTLVVRRYIERRHGIRAPEQTTEEFLLSAGTDPRFPRESLEKLKAFLTAADWVKFANYHPGPEAAPQALETARHYVESDSTETGKEGA